MWLLRCTEREGNTELSGDRTPLREKKGTLSYQVIGLH